MDLHEIQSNIWYMHIIDFTRLSNAVIIRSKTVAVKRFLKHWVSLFGVPRKIFSDNGGEFIGVEFYDMCDVFNIKIDSTPSYSPWSNGLCEHHNQTLTSTFLKIKEDIKCDMDTALAWAVSAKNTFINNNGFSSALIGFGENCMFPSIINDNLSALECFNQSPNLAVHIATLYSARRAFIACESSEKIKRAL